jgi:hypothetical protein
MLIIMTFGMIHGTTMTHGLVIPTGMDMDGIIIHGIGDVTIGTGTMVGDVITIGGDTIIIIIHTILTILTTLVAREDLMVVG